MNRFRDFYNNNQRWIPIVFFVAGFAFDAVMLRRIDEPITIAQQALYIIVCAVLIRFEIVESQREIHPVWILKKIWKYREAVLHFLMGTLLNAYTIFYFKSASAFESFLFIALLVGLLMLNEFGRMGKSQTQVHIALLSLCLISYLVTLVPIVLGFIGIFPFLIANLAAICIFWLYMLWLKPTFETELSVYRKQVVLPFSGILTVFAILYFAHAIPPVPLSVRFMGIYHDIKKADGHYELSFDETNHSFWQHGDQDFKARPGDTLFCFARIFSPTRFNDRLQVRWLFDDARNGWRTSDVIALPIVGGREEGYRGITKKTNYQPGRWRVQIETLDNREIGRITFQVEADSSTEPRELKTVME